MLFLWTILLGLLLVLGHFLLPLLLRYARLRRDYRTIPGLPLSPIPFIGNLHQCDSKIDVFYRFLQRMAKQCQEQNEGIFVLWYSLWPVLIVCSGDGLEVNLIDCIVRYKSFSRY